jgi:hypothetical protein
MIWSFWPSACCAWAVEANAATDSMAINKLVHNLFMDFTLPAPFGKNPIPRTGGDLECYHIQLPALLAKRLTTPYNWPHSGNSRIFHL